MAAAPEDPKQRPRQLQKARPNRGLTQPAPVPPEQQPSPSDPLAVIPELPSSTDLPSDRTSSASDGAGPVATIIVTPSSDEDKPTKMASRSHENYGPGSSASSLDQHHGVPGVLPPGGEIGSAYPPHGGFSGNGGRRVQSAASSDYGDFPPPSASVPSLPRYASSGGHSSSDYSSAPGRPGAGGPGSPLRAGRMGPASSSAGHGGSSHPLSNTLYAESHNRSKPDVGDDEKASLRTGAPRPNGAGGASSAPGAGAAIRPRAARGGVLARAYRVWTGANVGDSGLDERHVKKKRLGYLDGLKLLASLVVMNGTLFDAVLSDNDYPAIQRNSPLYIVRSYNLGIVMLLLLSGRSLIAPLWDAPNPHAQGKNVDPRKPLISWPRLTRAMLVRPFRFILPVIVVAALQWGLASGGASRATKNCNAVGMDEPYWSQIQSFAGYTTLVFDLFTYFEFDTLAGKAFGGNLWTVPWFFQASYCVYVTHFMLGNLSSNRYWVYGILIFFSWTSYNFFAIAAAGLFIADMAAHGQTARIRKWPVTRRVLLWLVLTGVALVTQWVNPIRDGLDKGLAKINVTHHTEIAFTDCIFAIALLFIVETSEVAQMIFGNVFMRTVGRLSPGIYLLASPVVFTAVPDVALSMHNSGSNASAILGVSWALMFAVVVVCAVPFHFFVECPSKLAGEYAADFFERWGAVKETTKASSSGTTAHHNVLKKNAASSQPRVAGSDAANRQAISAAVKGNK